MSSLARADQILVSDATRQPLPEAAFSFRSGRDVRLKGFGSPHRTWEMDWRAEQEADLPQPGTAPSANASLLLAGSPPDLLPQDGLDRYSA